jgi:hypothetical protein
VLFLETANRSPESATSKDINIVIIKVILDSDIILADESVSVERGVVSSCEGIT